MRFGDGRSAQEANEDGGQIEASVEAVLDLGEVAMGVLGVVERMVGSREGGLQIAQEGVDGSELFELDAGRAAAGDGALMTAPVVVTAWKHQSPSVTTSAEPHSDLRAHLATASLVNSSFCRQASSG